MIAVGYICDKCKHKRKKIDGWLCACDAFPDGIPQEHYFYTDIEKLEECNGGISYEENEDK